MKQTITINGTAYPFRLTIGAMVDYKRMTGEDFSQFRGDDMEKLGIIIYCAIRSACRADGVPFPQLNGDELLDHIDMQQAADLLGMDGKQEGGDGEKKG